MQSKVFIGEIIGYDAIQSFRALVPHEHQRVDQIERGKYGFGVLKSEENCTSNETWIPRNVMDTNRLYSCSSTGPLKMNVC